MYIDIVWPLPDGARCQLLTSKLLKNQSNQKPWQRWQRTADDKDQRARVGQHKRRAHCLTHCVSILITIPEFRCRRNNAAEPWPTPTFPITRHYDCHNHACPPTRDDADTSNTCVGVYMTGFFLGVLLLLFSCACERQVRQRPEHRAYTFEEKKTTSGSGGCARPQRRPINGRALSMLCHHSKGCANFNCRATVHQRSRRNEPTHFDNRSQRGTKHLFVVVRQQRDHGRFDCQLRVRRSSRNFNRPQNDANMRFARSVPRRS